MNQYLLDLPSPEADCYNELFAADGSVRAHWQPLIDTLQQQDAAVSARGAALARRLIVENGVTYNVYADPKGTDRPWALDPLPLVLTAAEWQVIERGVIQRATLMDRILADLYGPQRLLRDGVLPPEIAFGHPNFLWPCHGITPPGGRWMHLCGLDLARGPDGGWWVLNDRTQSPSGPGYALENRQIVSRVFPDLINDMSVRPLTGFFTALRDTLLSAAPDGETPLAVVLTPGAFNETYFEHAYLARQLGLPLVVGQDLTVRGDTLFLKTLAGLRRVHAVFRRLDDDFCDPVELRSDSALGVPGLLSAVRAGRVTVANALGSGVMESVAWHGFLPGAADALLGENLLLPSAATWWCGEAPALEEAIDNLDQLVIKPTFSNQRFEPVFGASLDARRRARVIERLRAQPQAYVAQSQLSLSQAPVWDSERGLTLGNRALVMRVYAVANVNGGYSVMAGGLARVAESAGVNTVSMQRGGSSKDIWVLGTAAAVEPSIKVPTPSRHDDLPSRLVENLFWLGRYAERCEGKTRILRATLAVRFDPPAWALARAACHASGILRSQDDPATALFDDSNGLGLAADLRRLVWCATEVRGRLSGENWRAISVMQREFNDAGKNEGDPREALDRLLLALAALAGFALDDMTRDHGWRLLMLGRRIERLQAMAQFLSDRLRDGHAPRQTELEWMLDVGDSTITYRTRYLAAPRLPAVLALLIRDYDNPRALAFQCASILSSLERLSEEFGGVVDEGLETPLAALMTTDLEAAMLAGRAGELARVDLSIKIMALSLAAGGLSDRLGMRHFNHVSMHMVAV